MRLKTLKPRLPYLKTERVPILPALQANGDPRPATWRTGKTAAQRGYGYRWQKARLTFLREHPLCAMCQRRGKVTPSTVVDHIVPHRGDQAKFWDTSNWQALCKPCHDRDKQRIERATR